ncbi:MAG: 1,4-dihydroxy-2-naphthoate polyprenyltransferase [Actinomycetales bacterium]
MATAGQWLEGARPRTLPAAVAPVLVGSGAAGAVDGFRIERALLALGVALALQVGVNYANDYSDGVRGTDAERVGPLRLTGSGVARPSQVRAAALAAFALSGVLGLVLVALSGQWWLLAVGAASVAAAWFYTGGSNPYGYLGFGELFVFVFFGLVAVLGTTYTQAGRFSWTSLAGACAVGALACAILVANNLRDIPTDEQTGKRTLAVRLGDARTRLLYLGLVALAFVVAAACAVAHPWALLALLAVVLAIRPVRLVRSGAGGRELIAVLRGTGQLELAYAALLALGIAL